MQPIRWSYVTLSAVIVLWQMPSPAWAQQSVITTDQGLQEVVVTAQKRPEDAQKVPVSMTIFTATDLAEYGVNNFRQLQDVVPNLTFAGVDTSINPTVSIRGISSDTRNIGFESGVSMYIDGVYTGPPSSFNFDTLDVSQIEVLRGPQGTLFGKNTTAGAINVTTASPGNLPHAIAELQYGNYDAVVARGLVGGPLVEDRLAGDVGMFYRYHDGYETNLFNDKKLYGEDIIGGQGKLRFTPSDALEFILASDGLHEHYRPDVNVLTADSFGYTPGQDPRAADIDAAVFQHRDVFGASLTANVKLNGGYALTSITAYRMVDTEFLSDDDMTPLPFLTSDFRDTENQVSEELRFASPIADRLNYVLGVFLYDEHVGTARASVVPPDTLVGPEGVTVTLNGGVSTQSYAAFAQANFKINDALRLTAGVRYTYEHKDMDMFLVGSPIFGIIDLTTTQSLSDSNVSPMASLEYAFTPDVNAYAKVARGFKSGGFNLDYVSSEQLQFRPETVTSYELGLKTQVARNLRLNVSGFYMDYQDLQVESYEQLNGFVISNAATAHIYGSELDLQSEFVPGLRINAGLGYLHATFSSYPNAGGAGIDYTGNHLPLAPEWTGNASVQYNHRVGTLNAYAAADYSYRANFFTDAGNAPETHIPGYGLVDARLGFETGPWTFELWGKNLTDKSYLNDAGVPALGGALGQTFVNYGAPRTYGIRVAARF